MSHRTGFGEWLSDTAHDATLAKLGVVAAVLLLGIRLFAVEVFLVVIPLAVGVACLLYLATRDERRFDAGYPTLAGSVTGYLPAILLVALAALVALVAAAGERTFWTHLLTGGIGALLFGRILLTDEERLRPGVVLAEIVVVAVVVRFTALHATPGFVGVDIWTHVPVFVEGIARTGSLAPLAESKYLTAPVYHLYASVATLLVGAGRAGVYLTLGVVVPVAALFVYGTARLLLPARYALAATAIYAVADQFVRWGLHLHPNSVALVLFLGCAYFASELLATDGRAWAGVGLTVFSLGVVFTHQVSTAILLWFLGVAALVSVLARANGRVRDARGSGSAWLVGVFLLTLTVTVVSWVNTTTVAGNVLLWQMFTVVEDAVFGSAAFLDLVNTGGGRTTGAPPVGPVAGALVPFVEQVGFTLLLAGGVLGGLVLLRDGRSQRLTATYVLATAGMFLVVFGVPLFGVHALLPSRWEAFMYVPMAVMAAAALYYLSRHGSRRVVLAVLVVFAVGYPVSMAVAERATFDSPAFDDHNPRYAYTEPEIAAVRTVGEVQPPAETGTLYTDHPYRTLFRRVGGYERSEIAVLGTTGTVSDGPVVYRKYQSGGPAIFHTTGTAAGEWPGRVTAAAVCPAERDRVYANDQVAVCTLPPEVEP